MTANDAPTSLKPRRRLWIGGALRSVISVNPRTANIVATVFMLAVIGMCAYVGLSVAHPTPVQVHRWQNIAGLLGLFFVASVAGTVLLAWGDLRFAATPEQRTVARHRLGQAALRLCGDALVVGLLWEIWAQRYKGVITWVMKHPLAQFELIVTFATVITVACVLEALWYHWFLRGGPSQHDGPPPAPPTSKGE